MTKPAMAIDLKFDTSLAEGYTSPTQIARVLTEDWMARHMYCPVCGESSLRHAKPGTPVKDFVCPHCGAQFELKSRNSGEAAFDGKVMDGEYRTMISRITSLNNPSFFFMHYDRFQVNNLVIVPNCFFSPDVIEKRRPLPPGAKRAGWEGCNILMQRIPAIAKIPVILDGSPVPRGEVVRAFRRVYALQAHSLKGRGWIVDTLRLVERLGSSFTLDEMYRFAPELQRKYPDNHNIRAKIRQMLQILRDKGIIAFGARGKYRRL